MYFIEIIASNNTSFLRVVNKNVSNVLLVQIILLKLVSYLRVKQKVIKVCHRI